MPGVESIINWVLHTIHLFSGRFTDCYDDNLLAYLSVNLFIQRTFGEHPLSAGLRARGWAHSGGTIAASGSPKTANCKGRIQVCWRRSLHLGVCQSPRCSRSERQAPPRDARGTKRLPARPFSGEELQRAEMQTKDPAGNGILLGHKKIRS